VGGHHAVRGRGTFNISNGDYFRWSNMWPKFAAMFAVPDAEPRHISLAEFMADKAPVSDRIVAKHNLQPYAYSDISRGTSWTPSSARTGT
jgi:hypothetical protein